MSKYTTEVRYICETYADLTESKGYDEINDIIAESEDKIFEEYPIFDENYRSVLNTKILRHYYTREICAETVGLWKLWLNNTMNEIMPYYNQLYKSALLEFNPLYDTDISTTHIGSKNENNEKTENYNKTGQNTDTVHNSENVNTSENKVENSEGNYSDITNGNMQKSTDTDTTNRYSDTPQGGINGLASLEQNLYLTNASINNVDENERQNAQTIKNSTNKNNNSSNNIANQNRINDSNKTNITSENNDGRASEKFNSLNQYTEHIKGKQGGITYSAMLNEFRKTFLNIDMMIISDLSNLFFKLY